MLPRPNLRVTACKRLVQCDHCRFDANLPAVRHRVACIDTEVDEHLLDLPAVGEDHAHGFRQPEDQVHVLAHQAPQHGRDAGDDLVDVEMGRFDDLVAREGQQLPGDRGPARGGLGDLVELRLNGIGLVQTLHRQFGKARDGHQDVVEVMRHTAGQAAYRFHFLRLAKHLLHLGLFLFGPLALGDVLEQAVVFLQDPGAIVPRKKGVTHPSHGAVLPYDAMLDGRRRALLDHMALHLHHGVTVIGGHHLGPQVRNARKLLLGVARNAHTPGRVPGRHGRAALDPDRVDAIGDGLGDAPVALFAHRQLVRALLDEFLEVLLVAPVLDHQARLLECPADHHLQFRRVQHRLHHEVPRPVTDRLDGIARVTGSRNDDGRKRGKAGRQDLHKFQPAHSVHPQVGQNNVERVARQQVERLSSSARFLDAIAQIFQGDTEIPADGRLVVHNEYANLPHGRSPSGEV